MKAFLYGPRRLYSRRNPKARHTPSWVSIKHRYSKPAHFAVYNRATTTVEATWTFSSCLSLTISHEFRLGKALEEWISPWVRTTYLSVIGSPKLGRGIFLIFYVFCSPCTALWIHPFSKTRGKILNSSPWSSSLISIQVWYDVHHQKCGANN